MIVLAFDSATQACSAAVRLEGRIVARRFQAMERGHAEALLPMIDAVVAEAGIALERIDALAVTVGPGAFTGLRVGLAAAEGLAAALGRPCVGITTLEAVAHAVRPAAGDDVPLLVALTSKRADLFVQAFSPARDPLGAPAALAVAQIIATYGHLPLLALAGDGTAALAPGLAAAGVATRVHGDAAVPDAAVVAMLAEARLGAGPPPPLRPLYLRPPDVTLAPAARAAARGAIVTAGPRDAATIAAIQAEAMDEAWDETAIAGLLAQTGTFALLGGERRGPPVAFAMARRVVDEAEIVAIATRPAARRQGWGRRLLAAAMAAARAAGARRMFLEVAADNAPARALYDSAGFVEVCRRADYYRRGPGALRRDALVLARDLAPP